MNLLVKSTVLLFLWLALFCGVSGAAENADSWRKQGDTAFKDTNYEEAIRCYLEAVKMEPDDNVAILRGLAKAFRLYGEPGSSLQVLELILQANPDDDIALYVKGLIYFQDLNEPEKAMPVWDKFLQVGKDENAINSVKEIIEKYKTPGGDEKLTGRSQKGQADQVAAEVSEDQQIELHNQGAALYSAGKYAESFEFFKKGAEAGYSSSQASVAYFYFYGFGGVPRDGIKAAYWYEKSAEQGVESSQNKMANLYREGRYVEQDFNKALYWGQKSVRQQFPEAYYTLGDMMLKGQGVTKNEPAAYAYWVIAADGGVKEAISGLEKFAADWSAEQLKPARTAAFFMALDLGKVNVVTTLYSQVDVDLNASQPDKATILQTMAAYGHEEVGRFLVSKGADPNLKFELAVKHLPPSAIELLLAWGADPNRSDADQQPPLIAAIDDISKVKILLEHGSNVNSRGKNGQTPLHAVFTEGHGQTDLIKLLLEKGGDPRLADNDGVTPLHLTARYPGWDQATRTTKFFAREFIEKGVPINALTADGETPIFYAARSCDNEVVDYFLDHGGATSAKNRDGESYKDVNLSNCRWKGHAFYGFGFKNEFDREVKVALHYKDISGAWLTTDWIRLSPEEESEVFYGLADYVYYYAEFSRGNWGGDDKYLRINDSDKKYGFKQKSSLKRGGVFTINLN